MKGKSNKVENKVSVRRANLIFKLTIKNLKIEISLGFWELVVAVTVVMGLGERERERERSIGKKKFSLYYKNRGV